MMGNVLNNAKNGLIHRLYILCIAILIIKIDIIYTV